MYRDGRQYFFKNVRLIKSRWISSCLVVDGYEYNPFLLLEISPNLTKFPRGKRLWDNGYVSFGLFRLKLTLYVTLTFLRYLR
jgi:hypothetical protein